MLLLKSMETKKTKIAFVTTGGTIDKDYASCAGTYNFEIAEPAIERILECVNPVFEYGIISVLKKDSMDMNDDDRKKVYDVCDKIDYERIVITHGTDTMLKTAEVLSELENKIIVLVGSSKPERFKDSDANFNLGVAIGAINVIQNNGVYVAMNGRIYNWDKCTKIAETGRFVEK